jgi:PAS domain S-box-containing protein
MTRWCGMCAGPLLVALATVCASGASPKRVLLLQSFGRDFAPFNTFSGVLRTELVSQSPEPVDVFEVSVESARFRDTVQEGPLVDYLLALFSGRQLDLVVPIGGPAVQFAQRHRQELFPGTPQFDWRELQRWGISETRLPAGSRVLFRQPSFWELHKGRITAIMALCLGEGALIVLLVVNLLNRRRSERALRESEERFRLLMEQAPEAVLVYDSEQDRVVQANPQAERLFGCDRQELLASGPRRFYNLEQPDGQPIAQTFRANSGRALGGEMVVDERRICNALGQQLHCEVRLARLPAGERKLICASFIDITQRKQFSERLQSAAEEWQTTFDSITDLVMIVDREYRIIRVNAATVRFLGLPMERIVGSVCSTLMHGTSCPIDGCSCQKTFQTKLSSRLELYHAGSGKWLLLSAYPIQDAAGNVSAAVHVGRDITERKQTEAELLRQRTELAHIARVSTMGELAASLAHELNQPLGAILANAEAAELFLQQDPPALDELRDILAAIRKDDERAAEVIRRMRVLLHKRALERQPIEMNSLVEDVWQLVSGDAALRGVSLTADLIPALPKVSGDRIHLQQVLLNLMINGMDAMAVLPREKRRLSVCTRLGADGQVELAVIDSGHGIEPDKLRSLFEPFYTTKPNGMGMGLSIARTIIEAHHGRIWAENNASGGAAFRLALPVAAQTDCRKNGRLE